MSILPHAPADTPDTDIDRLAEAAGAAARAWRGGPAAGRAALLRELAQGLEEERGHLVALADEETHLGTARLDGELDRTAFQLRGFAQQLDENQVGVALGEAAVAGVPPQGRPALTRVQVPLGPVAVFAASNFPFAFSVLGGDTASALAAGCPVVVKAHPGHPRLSRATAAIAERATRKLGLASGVFGMIEGASITPGVRLVRHPEISAVAFTGSFKGGVALNAEAQARSRPIPFFGELGSINPVIALPAALQQDGSGLASQLAASIVNGCGQFCTSPGVIVILDSDGASDAFVRDLTAALDAARPHAMLNMALRDGFEHGVARFERHLAVSRLTTAVAAESAGPRAYLGQVSASQFLADPALHEEVFGPAALLVRAADDDEMISVLRAVGGSLTVTLWGADAPTDANCRLLQAAVSIAGRVLFRGVPTGVAVCAAQQHGGPWPASTRPESTSVGFAAVERFLRPVALQDAPAWALQPMPAAIANN
ncbi:aldehyde dehydrogenase (NADP(+)) [Corticibacter populi]|uniref:Aldehyde dehydrogenase (NADP(+)) n=1 Tax=Corticibacter populi TaxID=1550736 RepID=A0A3M6QS89_9BURK|nr:aldehyde dehydrogenase (NADP(+)) [Corticibacter populi]RMX05910.1 aldehyde dehydrogenase (NADP(+)) [Corticibacter populi]RZS30770.1 NADP-dependent aldehyde dehydrogenase [Corticibacter populi]